MRGQTMHHFFVQSSTTEIAALWAIETQKLRPSQIQFIKLRGYQPFSNYSALEPDKNWLKTSYWKKFPTRERLKHIKKTISLNPEDQIYTPQCNLSFIKILHNGMPDVRINLIEEGTANYIYKIDQPPYRNAFRKKKNEITSAIIKMFFGTKIFHKFGPSCFFPSYINSAFLLSEQANTDFANEKRIVANFKQLCARIIPKKDRGQETTSILILDPLPPSSKEINTILKKLIFYVENNKSLGSKLIIKPHPRDDIAMISEKIKAFDVELEVSRAPIEFLNSSHNITEIFVNFSSTALYAAMLDIPIKIIDFPFNKKSLIQQEISTIILTKSKTPPA